MRHLTGAGCVVAAAAAAVAGVAGFAANQRGPQSVATSAYAGASVPAASTSSLGSTTTASVAKGPTSTTLRTARVAASTVHAAGALTSDTPSYGTDSQGYSLPLGQLGEPGGNPDPTTTIPPPPTTIASPPTTVVTIPPSTTTTVPSSGGGDQPPGDLFGPFDTPLSPTAAVSPSSGQLAADIVNQYQTHYGDFGIQDQYPIVTVPANQPSVPVAEQPGCGNFQPNAGQAPIPASAAPLIPSDGDNPLIIWQPSTSSEWEFWKMAYSGGSWSACWGGRISDVGTSGGAFQEPYGLSASGLSYLALAITEADVTAGAIDHPMAIQMPLCQSFVSPATRTDCPGDGGTPSEGMLFRLPAGMAMPSGLTPFAQMVFRALQTYGAYMADRSGAVDIVAESPADWAATGHSGTDPITASWAGAPQYNAMAGIPWGSLQLVVG